MARCRWIVELNLPEGEFTSRPIITSKTGAQLDLEAHAAMAELLAWKPSSPQCNGLACFPIYPVPQELPPFRRFPMAHFDDAEAARTFAGKLHRSLSQVLPPWSERTRTVFIHHLGEASCRS